MTDTPEGWEGILEPGERILWQGRPDASLDFTVLRDSMTMMGVLFIAFALFWLWMLFDMTATLPDLAGWIIRAFFGAFGLVFLGLGGLMAGGRVFLDARRRAASHYTLTDRAAYIGVDLGGRRTLETYAIGPDQRIELDERPDRTGTIWFAELFHGRPRPLSYPLRLRIGGAQMSRERKGFERIAGARKVYGLMRQAQIAQAERNDTGSGPDNEKG